MKTRCVHIFPQFENISEIEAIREAYDNLFGLVADRKSTRLNSSH